MSLWALKCRASQSHLLSNYWWHFLHKPICFSLALTQTLQIVSFHVRASVQAFTVDRHGNFCRVVSAGIWTSPAKAHYPLSTCPCPQSWSTRNLVYFWISDIALSWSALETKFTFCTGIQEQLTHPQNQFKNALAHLCTIVQSAPLLWRTSMLHAVSLSISQQASSSAQSSFSNWFSPEVSSPLSWNMEFAQVLSLTFVA